MENRIMLRPGICDVDNRYYLPEELTDVKTTVNDFSMLIGIPEK